MHAAGIIWTLSLVFTITAALLDLRWRRIPNWLTVPGLVAGLTVHSVLSGWHGTLFALEGALLALGLLLPLVLLRGLGAGDWKLLGAVGAILGPVLVLFVIFGSILASGAMAIFQMFRTGRVVETFRNMFVLVRGFFTFGLKANRQISLDNPHLIKLPFGVAVAAATIVCYCAARWAV